MVHEFTLLDADGVSHRYEVTPHSHEQGRDLFWRLMALGVEPLAEVANLATKAASLGKVDELLDREVEDVLRDVFGDVDLSKLGPSLRRSLMDISNSALAEELLRLTNRDGKDLAVRLNLDAAFTRNWSEYARALWEVLKVNRFLSLPGTTGAKS